MMNREITQKWVARAWSNGHRANDRWMGKVLHLEWALLFCQFLAFSTQAANWYVDNAVTGANNGTSWANAWTDFSRISWGSVKAGDIVYISGGTSSQTYNQTLTIGSSGTSANRITIKVGQDIGHNGKVIIDAQNTRNVCVEMQGNDYVTISGNNGMGLTNLVLKNAGSVSSSDRYSGAAINSASSPTGDTIEYVEVADCNNGFNLHGGSGNVVRFCYLHGIRGDRGIIMGGADIYDDCQIYNCTIQLNYPSDYSGYGPDGIQGGSGITVHDCRIYSAIGPIIGLPSSSQHMDGCQTIGNHWKIYNCVIQDMGNAVIEGGSVGSSWNSYLIYNNIFTVTDNDSSDLRRGFEFSPNSSIDAVRDIYVLNNTFVDLSFRAFWWGSWSDQNPSVSNVVIQNNIFYNCGWHDNVLLNFEPSTRATQGDYQIDYNEVNAGRKG